MKRFIRLGVAMAFLSALAGCATSLMRVEESRRYAADGAGAPLGGMEFALSWDAGGAEGRPLVLSAVSYGGPRELRIDRIELASRRAILVKEVRARIGLWRWSEEDGRHVASVPLYGLEQADRMLRFEDDVSIRLMGRATGEELDVVFNIRREDHSEYVSR